MTRFNLAISRRIDGVVHALELVKLRRSLSRRLVAWMLRQEKRRLERWVS